jgi:NADH-quinone oxidoreductase subunit M
MGGYGLLRFCLPLFPHGTREFAPVIAALAIIGILYGALVSWVQPDVKKLIAYSSVSHMGFVVVGIMALNPLGVEGAVFQMLNHGVTTGMLFAMAGMLYERRHTHKISEFGGLATPMPVFSSFFLLACLSSLGLPPLNSFVGEFLILLGVFQVSHIQAVLSTGGVILAALYLLWMYQRVIYGQVTKDANKKLSDLSRRELAILLPLAALILWMGLASPIFTKRIEPTIKHILTLADSPNYELADNTEAGQ